MNRFTGLPPMAALPSGHSALLSRRNAGPDMHCGGCGAKLAAQLLRACLQQLQQAFPEQIAADSFADDAAVVPLPVGGVLVQTVDSLRQLDDDPWIMGRIAAQHALSDIYAMGAAPTSCQMHITLPYAAASLQQCDLFLLMHGAMTEMHGAACRLLGGHSLEGAELSIGFTVNGTVRAGNGGPRAVNSEQALLTKTGLRPGDHLILTKALGTGVLFAAHGLAAAEARWIDGAIASMLQSNRAAAVIARQYGVRAATDVTGFGLLGHVLEMLAASALQASIRVRRVPLLAGAATCFERGHASTLAPANRAAVAGELAADELAVEINCERAAAGATDRAVRADAPLLAGNQTEPAGPPNQRWPAAGGASRCGRRGLDGTAGSRLWPGRRCRHGAAAAERAGQAATRFHRVRCWRSDEALSRNKRII